MSRHPAIAIIIAALTALIASCTGSTATAVEKIIIEPESITFAPGETKTVEITILPDNASDKTVIWSDSDAFTIDGASITASSTAQAGDYTLTASSRSNPDIKATLKATISASSAGGGGGGSTTPPTPPEEEPEEELTPDATIDISDKAPAGEITSSTLLVDNQPVESADQVFMISGLEPGKLYTFYPTVPVEEETVQPIMRMLARSALSTPLSRINGGKSYLFSPQEGESSVTFRASDMNLRDGDTFSVAQMQTNDVSSVDAPDFIQADGIHMLLKEDFENPLYETVIDGENHRVYEAYYSVNASSLPLDFQKDNVVLGLREGGSGSGNTNYGLLDSSFQELRSREYRGVLDLSELETIYLYSRMEISESDADNRWWQEVLLLNPKEITDEETTLSNPSIGMISPLPGMSSDTEYVLEFTKAAGNNPFSNYAISSSNPNGRIAAGGNIGYRHPYLFPIEIEDNRMIVYVGQLSETVIFDFIQGYEIEDVTVKLRKIKEEEKEKIEYITAYDLVNDVSYTIQNHGYIPIIFDPCIPEEDLMGLTVSLHCQDESLIPYVELKVVASHSSREGFSEMTIGNKEDSTREFQPDDILEHAYISYDKFDGDMVNPITVDISFSK